MRADGVPKIHLSRRETALGFNSNPDGLLQCHALRAYVSPSAYRHDGMHVLLGNGVVGFEVAALTRALRRPPCQGGFALQFADLQAFFESCDFRLCRIGKISKARALTCREGFFQQGKMQ